MQHAMQHEIFTTPSTTAFLPLFPRVQVSLAAPTEETAKYRGFFLFALVEGVFTFRKSEKGFGFLEQKTAFWNAMQHDMQHGPRRFAGARAYQRLFVFGRFGRVCFRGGGDGLGGGVGVGWVGGGVVGGDGWRAGGGDIIGAHDGRGRRNFVDWLIVTV